MPISEKKTFSVYTTFPKSALSGMILCFIYLILGKFSDLLPKEGFSWQSIILVFFLGFLSVFFWDRSKEIYSKILLGMAAGAVFGFVFGPEVAESLSFLGEIFIRLLKMIIVPLVFASLTLGVVSLGDIKKISRIGSKTLVYFMLTTIFAVLIGIFFANIFRPGDSVSESAKEKYQQQYKAALDKKLQDREKTKDEKTLKSLIVNIVPENPIQAFSSGNILSIIFFALFFGLVLIAIEKEKRQSMEKLLETLHDAMITMVMWIMKLAPFGVFVLMANTVANSGLEVLTAMIFYAFVVILAFAVHILLVFGTSLYLFGRINIWEFFRKTEEVWLLAFSTSSSAATLPITMRCAEEKLQIPKEICGFVLPIGATINMDGTCLYLGISAMFLAQICGIPMPIEKQFTVLLIATLCSVGSPGIPGGSLVFLIILLESLHIPTSGIALILGIDRILDMFRTTVNVLGDMTAAIFIASTEKSLGQ